MTTLAWGIIGTGAIAKTFAKGLARSQTGRLVAVGSRTQESADQFGQQFGIAAPHRHSSYQDVLDDPAVQAVYIGLPHTLHAQWAIKAAQARKHVLCEKPLGVNYAQAASIVEAARTAGVFLMEGFMYRCHPQTARLIELLRGRAVGQVLFIQATTAYRAEFDPDSLVYSNALAGGGILDIGCYCASVSRLAAGAAMGRDFADPLEVKAVGHLGQTGVDEWTAAVVRFDHDIVGQWTTTVASDAQMGLTIVGQAGTIRVPNFWVANRDAGDPGLITIQPHNSSQAQEIRIDCPVTSYTLEADVAARAIAADQQEAPPPAMTWADTLGNMKALDQWRQSLGLVYDFEKKPGTRA